VAVRGADRSKKGVAGRNILESSAYIVSFGNTFLCATLGATTSTTKEQHTERQRGASGSTGHSFHGLREVEVVGVDERGAVEEGGVTYTIDAIATPKFTVDTVRERLSLLV
jgi:5-keto 4-deoxyuronate isomerase